MLAPAGMHEATKSLRRQPLAKKTSSVSSMLLFHKGKLLQESRAVRNLPLLNSGKYTPYSLVKVFLQDPHFATISRPDMSLLVTSSSSLLAMNQELQHCQLSQQLLPWNGFAAPAALIGCWGFRELGTISPLFAGIIGDRAGPPSDYQGFVEAPTFVCGGSIKYGVPFTFGHPGALTLLALPLFFVLILCSTHSHVHICIYACVYIYIYMYFFGGEEAASSASFSV